jgi:hypothetical protein
MAQLSAVRRGTGERTVARPAIDRSEVGRRGREKVMCGGRRCEAEHGPCGASSKRCIRSMIAEETDLLFGPRSAPEITV